MGEQLLFSCVALPALFGLVCYVLPKRLARAAALIALPGAAATFLLCALLPGMKGAELRIPWLSVGGFEVSLSMRVGALSGFAAAFIGLFGLLVACFSLPYMWSHRFQGRYYAFTFWALAGAIGATLADHLVFFLIAWEVVTLMLYLLVNLGREPAAKVGAKTFVLLGFADAALLLGIVFLWKLTGTMSVGELAAIGAGTVAGKVLPTTVGLGAVAFLLMFAGAIAKAGAVPLHTWIPSSAEAAPLPVMAFLPAALDKLLGISLLARLTLQFFVVTPTLGLVVMIVGAVTVIAAVMMAMVQHDLRKLLAYHAVSQVGYMVLGLGTGSIVGILGGLFHMLNHAIYKCCLFLMAGAVRHRTGTTELERLGGLARAMPATFIAGAVAALAISGVPPLNGFASKWMVYQGVLETHSTLAPLLLVAAVFGSALTLASFVKVIHSVFLGRPSDDVAGLAPGKVPVLMVVPMAVLAALCIVFGVFVQLPVGQWIAPSVSELSPGLLPAGQAVSYGIGVWQASQATVLLVVGLALGLVFYAIGRIGKARVTRPFLGGELLGTDEVRVPGTGFYETVRGLPLLRGMFHDAEEEVYDVYHLGGRYGGALVQHLRNLHTGVLAVYVAWCVLGLAAVLFYLLPL
ncbi:MAG TPA: proton-conducting transporter membrane subunit [Planctomycetota bacterium]|nr:proton-conducting transporter membrane subunit [Planctomycetota bacterium]